MFLDCHPLNTYELIPTVESNETSYVLTWPVFSPCFPSYIVTPCSSLSPLDGVLSDCQTTEVIEVTDEEGRSYFYAVQHQENLSLTLTQN